MVMMKIMVSKGVDSIENSWVFYSVCYFYMCCNRDWFDIYKAWDKGFVLLANNLEFNVVGIEGQNGQILHTFKIFNKIAQFTNYVAVCHHFPHRTQFQ